MSDVTTPATPDAPVRVVVIGSGSICRFRHAPEYHANPDAQIVAFVDPVLARADWCAAKWGGQAFDKWEDAIALNGVNAVSVCTPNYLHAPLTIAALKAGKHVLCEKPMATSDDEARAMVDASAAAGKFLMIGHNQRLAPLHIKAREIVASGVLGKIISFRTSFAHGGPENWSIERDQSWFFHKDKAFIGAMGDLGVHKTDLLRYLLGEEIVEASAFVEHLEKANSDVDDTAVCLLRTQSGAVGTLTATWTHHPGEDNATVIYGENGTLRMGDSKEFGVTVRLLSGENQFYQVGALQTNDGGGQNDSGVVGAFVQSIKTDTPPVISGDEGRKALAVILACLESAQTKRHVMVKG